MIIFPRIQQSSVVVFHIPPIKHPFLPSSSPHSSTYFPFPLQINNATFLATITTIDLSVYMEVVSNIASTKLSYSEATPLSLVLFWSLFLYDTETSRKEIYNVIMLKVYRMLHRHTCIQEIIHFHISCYSFRRTNIKHVNPPDTHHIRRPWHSPSAGDASQHLRRCIFTATNIWLTWALTSCLEPLESRH